MTENHYRWAELLVNAVMLVLGWLVMRWLLPPGLLRVVALTDCGILGAVYGVMLLFLAVCEVILWRRGLKQ